MTDNEILLNSKRIIDIKKDIESGDTASPDIEDQVREKFLDDCINRARFVDSSLIIAAVAKEFRNVFGVDAPNYEITSECRLPLDKNENGRFEEDECIEIKDDPMRDPNIETSKTFIDSWAVIDAARFDCPFPVQNFEHDESLLPVEKQKFFVDKKRDEESSSFHFPICPPGFDKWAGAKVYDKICKNFDLNEVAIYKLFRDIPGNTIPQNFEMQFDGDNKLSYNIDEEGRITKNYFNYNLKEGSGVEQELREVCNGGSRVLPGELCNATDSAPIKWYTVEIPITSVIKDGKYYYEYSYESTPFEKTEMPIMSFSLIKKGEKEPFNSGYAIFCTDPSQKRPDCGRKNLSKFYLRFCIHILERSKGYDSKLDAGENYDKNKRFFGIKLKKTKRVKVKYTGIFEPVNVVPDSCKEAICKFIINMLKDCFEYYNLLQEREINNTIPDYKNSIEVMSNLYSVLNRYINRTYHDTITWNKVLDKLEDRVMYDITGKTNATTEEKNKIFNPSQESEITLKYDGQTEYITDWIIKSTIKWPKFILKWFKTISEPEYKKFKKILVNSTSIEKNFKYNYIRRETIGSKSYVGPKDRDLTKKVRVYDHDRMITLYHFVNDILNESERQYLIKNGKLKYNNVKLSLFKKIKVYTYLFVDGYEDWLPIDDTTKYDIVYTTALEQRPTYDKIQRATDLNWYMKNNSELFETSFQTIDSRIDKRTGTLRKTFNILDSANINIQMLQKKKQELRNLRDYMDSFEIQGGFGTKEATIQLTAWEGEDISKIYSTLGRISTVYLLSDNTTLKIYNAKQIVNIISSNPAANTVADQAKVIKFDKNYVKTTITDIIEQISDTQYEYNLTEDDGVKSDKTYYVVDELTGEYRLAENDEIKDENLFKLFERGSATSGPVFKVKLQDDLPKSFEGHNPRMVKVF